MKKVLCVILSLIFALSCFVLTVSAEETVCAHNYTGVYKAPTCADRGYTLYTCSKCGDYYMDNYVSALGHSYGDFTVEQVATCSEEGFKVRYCTRCGGADTVTISVLTHVDNNNDGKCDNCGASMPKIEIFSPYDWIIKVIKEIIEWFRAIFA